jgi:methionine-gamma-lyase
MRKHSENALYLAEEFEKLGIKVYYPGLKTSKHYDLINEIMNEGFGYSGMLAIDAGSYEKACNLMELMQKESVGYLAVSLGYFKTLFSAPGHSTSSEIPEEEQKEMGLTEGLVRFSVGLDGDISIAFERIKKCMQLSGILMETEAEVF